MAKRFKIGVDVDDVLTDFVAAHRTISRRLFNKPEDPTARPVDWDFSNYGLTAEEHEKIWEEINATPNFWMKLLPSPLANEIDTLTDQHDVFFITNRRERGAGFAVSEQTQDWLRQTFSIIYPQVIVAKNKDEIARALKLDYFIDDRPENCVEVKTAISTCQVYLKKTSHNNCPNGPDPAFNMLAIHCVQNLNEFAQIVERDAATL